MKKKKKLNETQFRVLYGCMTSFWIPHNSTPPPPDISIARTPRPGPKEPEHERRHRAIDPTLCTNIRFKGRYDLGNTLLKKFLFFFTIFIFKITISKYTCVKISQEERKKKKKRERERENFKVKQRQKIIMIIIIVLKKIPLEMKQTIYIYDM